MKLYRYEIGSDDGDEEIMAGKELHGDFLTPDAAYEYIRRYNHPVCVDIKTCDPFVQFNVFMALPCNETPDFNDEVLWLLG